MSIVLLAILLIQPAASTAPAPAPVPETAGRQAPASPPRRLLEGSISNDDYPAEAMRVGASGTAVVAVEIAADGRVTACRSTQSAGHPALDARTCELVLARFRFQPAPSASSRSLRIGWRLADVTGAALVPFASSRVIVQTSYPASGPAFCQRFVEGQPPTLIGTMRCAPNATAPSMPSEVARRLTSVQEFIANGHPLPNNPLVREDAQERTRLRIEVDQRGIVTGCGEQVADDEIVTSNPTARRICDGLSSATSPIFAPSTTPGTREGIFTESLLFGAD